MSKIELGIHPIGWTNDDMPELGDDNTFEQCVSEMALAGYVGTEIGHKYPRDPAELHSYLDPRGLRVTSCWTSLFLTTKPYEETEKDFIDQCEFLQAMGAKCVVVSEQGHSIQGQTETPIFDAKPVFTDEEWDRLTSGLEKLADVAAPYGPRAICSTGATNSWRCWGAAGSGTCGARTSCSRTGRRSARWRSSCSRRTSRTRRAGWRRRSCSLRSGTRRS